MFAFEIYFYGFVEDNNEGAKDENPIRQVIKEEKGEIKADGNHETLEVEKNDPVEQEKIILTTAASTKEVRLLATPFQ